MLLPHEVPYCAAVTAQVVPDDQQPSRQMRQQVGEERDDLWTAKLTVLAEHEHRSLNKQVEFLLDRSVRDDEEAHEIRESSHQKSERPKRK